MYHTDKEYWPVINLAIEVGLQQKRFFRKKNLQVTTKSNDIDMLTEVDLLSEKRIIQYLQQAFPSDSILAEEQGETDKDSDYEWIIDPLDGTTNYSIGLPIFAVSIARWHKNRPEFGVVYIPMLDELFYAQKSFGAYRNGELLSVSRKQRLREAVLATGVPYDRATASNNNAENICVMIPLVKGIRRMGAAAYDLSLVASGIFDAFWELRLNKWDIAAAWLFITEAGGEFRVFRDGSTYSMICGNSALCDAIAEQVKLD